MLTHVGTVPDAVGTVGSAMVEVATMMMMLPTACVGSVTVFELLEEVNALKVTADFFAPASIMLCAANIRG